MRVIRFKKCEDIEAAKLIAPKYATDGSGFLISFLLNKTLLVCRIRLASSEQVLSRKCLKVGFCYCSAAADTDSSMTFVLQIAWASLIVITVAK